MADEDDLTRHSKADPATIITDADELAKAEARNALRQFDLVLEMVEEWLQPERRFRLRVSHILTLHRTALEGINSYAGNFRPGKVEIGGSGHNPPDAHLVAELVEKLCDYVNDNWDSRSALHLASYVMWRMNWIHPFSDGNGRTSRAVSYFVLCLKLGYRLPGRNTILEQIATNKKPYYQALEQADKAEKQGNTDLGDLERLLEGYLANQLVEIYNAARGEKTEERPLRLH